MEDCTGAGHVSIAAPPEPEVKQDCQASMDLDAATKMAGPPATGKLREPELMSEEDENEESARRCKPARRPLKCQVDGCGADLTQARKYFQRYRVCERHLKAPSLQMDGRNVRFCDQCSKFHDVSQFEGLRRTCNDKLERTRQARSDKRRQQTEQAERATMRASGGLRSRGFGGPGMKRLCDNEYDGHDDPADEDYAPDAGVHTAAKRSKGAPGSGATPQPPPRAPPPASLHASGPSVLAQLSDPLKAQGILALQCAALAAAAGGSGAASAAAAASGHQHPLRVQGGGGPRGANGSNDGCGTGGGPASSLSSWDDGHPQVQLMRMDSVSSRPGSASTAPQGSGPYTPAAAAGASAGAAASRAQGVPLPYNKPMGREAAQVLGGMRPQELGQLRPGLMAVAGAAGLLQELHQLGVSGGGGGGGADAWTAHRGMGDVGWAASLQPATGPGARGEAAGQAAVRSHLEALLLQTMYAAGGGGRSALAAEAEVGGRMASSGLLGPAAAWSPPARGPGASLPWDRVRAWSAGRGDERQAGLDQVLGAEGHRLVDASGAIQRLLQLGGLHRPRSDLALDLDRDLDLIRSGPAAPAPPPVAPAEEPGPQEHDFARRLPFGVQPARGEGGAVAGPIREAAQRRDAPGDGDATTAAVARALRLLLASLDSRRGGGGGAAPHSLYEDDLPLLDHRLREESLPATAVRLAAGQVPLGTGAARLSAGAGALLAAGPLDTTRLPSAAYLQPPLAPSVREAPMRAMPVLDLAEAPPPPQVAGGRGAAPPGPSSQLCGGGGGASSVFDDKVLLLLHQRLRQQQQHQQLRAPHDVSPYDSDVDLTVTNLRLSYHHQQCDDEPPLQLLHPQPPPPQQQQQQQPRFFPGAQPASSSCHPLEEEQVAARQLEQSSLHAQLLHRLLLLLGPPQDNSPHPDGGSGGGGGGGGGGLQMGLLLKRAAAMAAAAAAPLPAEARPQVTRAYGDARREAGVGTRADGSNKHSGNVVVGGGAAPAVHLKGLMERLHEMGFHPHLGVQ